MSPPSDLDSLSLAELRSLVGELFERVGDLTRTVAEQRNEIARLKGLKGRPDIKPGKPSGMEKASHQKPWNPPRRGGGNKTSKRIIHEERVVKASVPLGSRFKGYESFVVQDLVLRPHVVRYRRERWLTPDGRTVIAPLPCGVSGHFGAELRRFVLVQHHQGQVTVARLLAQLRGIGIDVSKRQVMRLLIDKQEAFVEEARDVLRAGLETASWISVDDTGARHQGRNATCTQIGNDHFTWFGTTGSKSRLNFLECLRAGHADYVVNQDALAYMRERALAGPLIARLAAHADRHFADAAAWTAHLQRLGIAQLTVTPDPSHIATEGAVFGSIKAHGFLGKAVILSDDAGQFDVGHHALCWVHAERLVHKLDSFSKHERLAQQKLRALIWWFYRDLLAYKRQPSTRRRLEMRARFDRIFKRRTGSVMLDRMLRRLHANKAELLTVLDRPEVPLHTNGSENDIRCQVTKRKISGGTRSHTGRHCRDAFLSLAKTCAKLGIAFWDYLGARLKIPDQPPIPSLQSIVSHRCQTA
jgi:sugar phosphate isomerase/epimerase